MYEIEFFVAHAACPLKTVRARLMDLRILTVRGARGTVDSFFFPDRPVRLNLRRGILQEFSLARIRLVQ